MEKTKSNSADAKYKAAEARAREALKFLIECKARKAAERWALQALLGAVDDCAALLRKQKNYGWTAHPSAPGYFYKDLEVLSEAQLRERFSAPSTPPGDDVPTWAR